jgi:hypothetical protein
MAAKEVKFSVEARDKMLRGTWPFGPRCLGRGSGLSSK